MQQKQSREVNGMTSGSLTELAQQVWKNYFEFCVFFNVSIAVLFSHTGTRGSRTELASASVEELF